VAFIFRFQYHTVHGFIYVCFLCVSVLCYIVVVLLRARWGGPDGIEA